MIKSGWIGAIGAAVGFAVSGNVAVAGTLGGIYDMSRLLNEPHPFATTRSGPRDQFSQPVAQPTIPRPAPAAQPLPQVRRVSTAPQRRFQLRTQSAPAASRPMADKPRLGSGLGGILSEARLGVLVHDEGPFSRNKEDGFDTNFEFLFVSPDFTKIIWSPRPHIGGTINSAGNTSQAYIGATWEWDFWRDYFFNFSLGGAYHTGETETSDTDKKSLGCSVLFRESLNLGYRITGSHSVMFHFDHISNAKLCSTNEGLETFGIRYGYTF